MINRLKLKEYQNSYAEQMAKYSLQRSVDGSEAIHVATSQYYRGLYAQNKIQEENIEYLQELKQKVYDSVRYWYDQKDGT